MNTPETKLCDHCSGSGRVWATEYRGNDPYSKAYKCGACNGTGRIPAQGPETARHAPVKASGVCSAHQYPEVGGRNYDPFCLVCWPDPPSAGERELEQLLDTIFDIEDQYQMGGGATVAENAALLPEYRAQQYAAINAYIARRVLEVIGEDEDDRPEITEWIVHSKEATKARNELRAEQRQRIAVIKKESQQ